MPGIIYNSKFIYNDKLYDMLTLNNSNDMSELYNTLSTKTKAHIRSHHLN